MAYRLKVSKLKELINFAEQELGLDINKMNDHDLQTVSLIKYQKENIFADEEPLLKEEQQDIDELMARAKKEVSNSEKIKIEKLIATYEEECKDNIKNIINSGYNIETVIKNMGKTFGITDCLIEKHNQLIIDGHSSNVAWILCAVEFDLV